MFKASFEAMLEQYWAVSPRVVSSIERLYTAPGGYGADQLAYDHIGFRTFGVPNLGIDSMATALQSLGFERRGQLEIPDHKLVASWFAPPPVDPGGPPAYELLPRVVVSELQVDLLSPQARSIVRRYTSTLSSGGFGPAAAWAAALTRALPWDERPSWDDYCALLEESEYAAWVLVNGYAMSHAALACHRARPPGGGPGGAGAGEFAARLASRGFALVGGGGGGSGAAVSASEDGLLLQAGTVADLVELWFSGEREPRLVPGSYLELTERRPLTQRPAPDSPAEALRLRDGFDAACCARLVASTALAAKEAAAMAEAGQLHF